MDTVTRNQDGTVTLRGWHHTHAQVLPRILSEGFKVAEHGAHAWGVGVYATLQEGCLRHAFKWRAVEILIEATVPAGKLVVVTGENDREAVDRYLTWGANDAYAVLVDIPDHSDHVSGDCACQFRVPPEAVRVLAYRHKAGDEYLYLSSEDYDTGLVWL